MNAKIVNVTKDVIEALQQAVKAAGGQVKFSEITGVSQARISQILTGQSSYMRPECAEKLHPYIRKQSNKHVGVVQNNIHGDNHAPMLSQDDELLLDWLNRPENRKIRLELLLKIEETKN